MVVLIIKGDVKYFCGIRLVEVLWKATTGIINRRLTAAISYHNSLNRFWTRWGAGTAILEAEMLQHMTAMKEAVLHTVVLDIQRAYYSLS